MVQLDLDLKYRVNIRELFQEFHRFPPGAVIGIARELQPVYRWEILHFFFLFIHTALQTLCFLSLLVKHTSVHSN